MKKIILRFAGYQNHDSIHNQAARYFLQLLKEQLGDKVEIELIENVLILGRKSGDLPMMVKSGEITCCYISTVRFTDWIPEINILDLPFLIKDRPQAQAAFRGEFGRYLQTRFELNTPFTLLGIWDNGFRHITNKIRAIRRPRDCVGLSIRTQMSQTHVEALGAMGFIPIPVDVKVFVDEINGPRFDAQDNPLTNSFNFGVHHYHPFYTLTGHFFGGTAFIANSDIVNTWPPDIQNTFRIAAQRATEYQWQLASQEDELILNKMRSLENEIITLTEEEHAEFKMAVKPVFERYEKVIPVDLFGMFQQKS